MSAPHFSVACVLCGEPHGFDVDSQGAVDFCLRGCECDLHPVVDSARYEEAMYLAARQAAREEWGHGASRYHERGEAA